MQIENLIEENSKWRHELAIKRCDMKAHNLMTLAVIIEELYHLKVCVDLELKILIQEESHASLFSYPKILIKTPEYPDLLFHKDEFWVLEYIRDEDKLKRHSFPYISEENTSLNWSDNVVDLVNSASRIIESYEWDHFTNTGSLEKSPFWKSYQDEKQKGTNELVWIGSLSEANYINTLNTMWDFVYKDTLKELIVKKQKDRLERDLVENKTKTKNVAKI